VVSGAWPFLVRGVTCRLNCVNERDLRLLVNPISIVVFLFKARREKSKGRLTFGSGKRQTDSRAGIACHGGGGPLYSRVFA